MVFLIMNGEKKYNQEKIYKEILGLHVQEKERMRYGISLNVVKNILGKILFKKNFF